MRYTEAELDEQYTKLIIDKLETAKNLAGRYYFSVMKKEQVIQKISQLIRELEK